MARPDLPTGTVTFLFTDLEGSTRLAQDLGARYHELLAAHDEILREAVARHGGTVVNTEGDAFFVVFTSPQAGLSAAVQAQRALAARSWPGDSAVRVRMGLHTGEGTLGGADYASLDVNRAARIAGAAHGGQVLVSDATRALLGAADPAAVAGAGFRELGAYRLKDLDQPVRLHELTADGLPTGFPPPRARRLGMLPASRTSFVGREAVLDELRGLLDSTRLLVLTGPGGTGKTRLGLELARAVADGWPDGVFFVPLESISDPRLVPSAILHALDVPAGSQPPDAVLRAALAPMRVLLVLDNLEQIAEVATVVDGLLEAAPGLTVVATSRVALHLYGEQEYNVPPLSLPGEAAGVDPDSAGSVESVALFVDRARAARPGFRLTSGNAAAVAEICRRLDGLPLAIELAAARTRLLGPEAILARLDQRLRLLEDQAPNLPPRQRSMRGAIEWSYALLPEVEQRLLDRLSIFVGGWDLAAAEAVCNPGGELGPDVLDGIGSLVDKSLVVARDDGAEPRFAMLQTIQAYGRERLAAAGELDLVARRHADHVRGVVEAAEPEFTGPDPGACVARLVPDQDNIRAALGWAIAADEAGIGLAIGAAAWRLWQIRGQLAEGRRTLDALLALPSANGPDAPLALRARALIAAGGILYWQSEPAAADRYREALAIHEALGDEAGVAESLSNLGFAALTAKPPRLEEARSHFEEGLRRYERLDDRRMVASVTGALGFTAMAMGLLDEARALIERALELNLAGGYRGRAADNRFALGNLHRRAGRLPEAAAAYGDALRDAGEMADSARRLTYLAAVASWAVESGLLREAVRLGGAVRRAAADAGGSMTTAPGIIEPVAAARDRGLDEAVIAAELAAGAGLEVDGAVAFAFELLARPAAAAAGSTSAR